MAGWGTMPSRCFQAQPSGDHHSRRSYPPSSLKRSQLSLLTGRRAMANAASSTGCWGRSLSYANPSWEAPIWNAPAAIRTQPGGSSIGASAGSPAGSKPAIASVWRIVSVCCSSWRMTISHTTPSPTPPRCSASTTRARTARMYSRASAGPGIAISARTGRGVSKAS